MWLREKRVSTEAICRRDLEMNARRISIEENEMTKEKLKMHRVCKLHSLCNEKNKNPSKDPSSWRSTTTGYIYAPKQNEIRKFSSPLPVPQKKNPKQNPQNKTKQNKTPVLYEVRYFSELPQTPLIMTPIPWKCELPRSFYFDLLTHC